MIDLIAAALFQAVAGEPAAPAPAAAPTPVTEPAAPEAAAAPEAPAAVEPEAPAETVAEAVAPQAERQFCRSVRVSGTRLPVRQCVTETELREVAENPGAAGAARDGVRDTLRGGDRAGSQGNGFFQGGGGSRR